MKFFTDALEWLGTPANWSGPTGVGPLLIEHVWYSLLAVALASVIAIPLGWWIGHTGRGRGLAVGLSGAARALPTLGLITLFGLLLGVGLLAPMVAFVVLAIPSVLAGAYAGVEQVDRSTIDAARACGMTELGILRDVEIPLSAPVLLGGLRSAMLQVIATATLAAYVGSGGLGRLVFLGLKTQDYAVMLAGSLLVIALALLSEIAFSIWQRLATPGGATSPTRKVTS